MLIAAPAPCDTLRVSVVIPHLNQPEALAHCLASLRNGRRVPDEVIVVDNGSTALPDRICAAYGARLLSEATPGPGPARNAGAAAATGEIVAFIDADCIADRDWLAVMAERFATDPAAQILGGAVHIACGDPGRPTALEAYESVFSFRMDLYLRDKGFTGTGNLGLRAPVLAAVGPFAGLDVAEDRDWCHRATAAGHGIHHVPAMIVLHPARPGFAELAAKHDRALAHDFAAVGAGGVPARLRWAAKAVALPLSPLAELPQILTTTRLTGPRARLLAFAMLLRVRSHRSWRMLRLLAGQDPAALAGRWNRQD